MEIKHSGSTCLAKDKLRSEALVWGKHSPEQCFHANLVALSHHHNDPSSLRCIRMAGLNE